MAKTLQGKLHTWQLSDDPIGSGDAGEVYHVLCVEQPDITGMMKKPSRIATGGTIMRQAGQIALESLALDRLAGLPNGKAHPPRLLDEAPNFTQGTGNYFIVSEKAPGIDMASILTETRQTGKPFPRRVIITVLDALFDLFARAHKAGVLWNDVKLDHIYWHNNTGNVTVIDWGNAQFLSSEQGENQRPMPRWEDYRQLVNTLGNFLQQNAPELYADLGWDEFEGQQLDSPRVSVLARRIAYQQQVISLRVMEYQSLINVILSEDPSLVGLEKIQEYQQILEQIGAPWHRKEVLSYGKVLIQDSLNFGDQTSAIKALTIIWELFDESLDLPWYLAREYFRQTDILQHPNLGNLVRSTFNENWLNALWLIIIIARENDQSHWRQRIIPVLRQKALGLTTQTPLEIAQMVLRWHQEQTPAKIKNFHEISNIIEGWQQKGESCDDSPFDYKLLVIVQNDLRLPAELKIGFKQAFAPGQEIISELSRAWEHLDFDKLEIAIKKAIAWDPDRWGMIRTMRVLQEFRDWLNELKTGPPISEDQKPFLRAIIEKRPAVEKLLGTPSWLRTLLWCLRSISENEETPAIHTQLQNWCPWLSSKKISEEGTSHVLIEHELSKTEVIEHFTSHLKSWSDVESGLAVVKQYAPEAHASCEIVLNGFKQLLSITSNLEAFETFYLPKEVKDDSDFDSVVFVLRTFLNWRRHLENHELDLARSTLENPLLQDWRIIQHAYEITSYWQSVTLPILQVLMNSQTNMDPQINAVEGSPLSEAFNDWTEFKHTWKGIYQRGVHKPLLASIHQALSSLRADFLHWRKEKENDPDQISQLFYQTYLRIIRHISERLLLLLQHSQQVLNNFLLLEEGIQTTHSARMNVFEGIMAHLSAIEEFQQAESEDLQFPAWIEELRQISEITSPEVRQQVVLSLSDNHPLHSWLVQSVFLS